MFITDARQSRSGHDDVGGGARRRQASARRSHSDALRRGRLDVVDTPIRRGEVHLVELNPTRGRAIRKTRPCVVVSPDELNAHMGTFIVAPLTTGSHPYPFRIACRFAGKDGHLVLDQLRTVDRERLVKRLGALTAPTLAKALGVLQEMFSA